MRITKIHVKGFKSLVDFEMELAPFTCLIGMNGCGKSTVLQFFDFISHVLRGNVGNWYQEREWEKGEELSDSGATEISFRIEFEGGASWDGTYNTGLGVCRKEEIRANSAFIKVDENGGTAQGLRFKGGQKLASGPAELPLNILAYTGSVISILHDDTLSPEIKGIKEFIRGVRCFDTLSPHNLRRRDRSMSGSIGHTGEHLASYFGSMPEDRRERVYGELLELYPYLAYLSTENRGGGWKELVLGEEFSTRPVRLTRSRHISDGFLRMTAILAELNSPNSFVLFDEIENGINAEIVEALVETLTQSERQVLVTTHSPLILNYLDDETAREGVVFLYKGRDGATRAKRFFEIDSIREKLDLMGPGEAFVDTNLVALAEELNSAVSGA